jgi:putative FmdB family regulatory protein
MPIYEFRCKSCGERFEKLCPLGETGENISCPACAAPKPDKLISFFATRGVEGGQGAACATCKTTTSCAT